METQQKKLIFNNLLTIPSRGMAAWCLEPTDQTIPFKQTAHNNSSFVMLCQVCAAASVVACLWFFVLLALLTWSLHNISLQLRNFPWTLLRLNEQTVGHGDLQKELPLSPAMSLFNMSDQMPMEMPKRARPCITPSLLSFHSVTCWLLLWPVQSVLFLSWSDFLGCSWMSNVTFLCSRLTNCLHLVVNPLCLLLWSRLFKVNLDNYIPTSWKVFCTWLDIAKGLVFTMTNYPMIIHRCCLQWMSEFTKVLFVSQNETTLDWVLPNVLIISDCDLLLYILRFHLYKEHVVGWQPQLNAKGRVGSWKDSTFLLL